MNDSARLCLRDQWNGYGIEVDLVRLFEHELPVCKLLDINWC